MSWVKKYNDVLLTWSNYLRIRDNYIFMMMLVKTLVLSVSSALPLAIRNKTFFHIKCPVSWKYKLQEIASPYLMKQLMLLMLTEIFTKHLRNIRTDTLINCFFRPPDFINFSSNPNLYFYCCDDLFLAVNLALWLKYYFTEEFIDL